MAKTERFQPLTTQHTQPTAPVRGLIDATRLTEDETRLPCTLLRIGGITLLERHVRLLQNLDITNIIVFMAEHDERLTAAAHRLAKRKVSISFYVARQAPPDALTETPDACGLLLDGAALVDHRLPQQLLQRDSDRIAVAPLAQLPVADASRIAPLSAAPSPVAFAGCARLTPGHLQRLCPETHEHWLETFLSQILHCVPHAAVPLASLPTYIASMRRDLPYYWLPVRQQRDHHRGKTILLDAAQKGVLDWPAWYVHRPVEKRIVYTLCEWPITPNQVTVLCNLVAFWAVYGFAAGPLWGVLLAALCVGILDGIDGKLARVKQMTSRLGKLEHVFDGIYEYAWIAAMAYRLATAGYSTTPYILCGVILAVHNIEKLLLYRFEKTRGAPLDDFSPFDRRFRLVVGRRNTYMWLLIPFVAANAFYAGYWTITLYAILTLAERMGRIGFHALHTSKRRHAAPTPPPQP